MGLILKAREGLVRKQVTVTRGGKSYFTNVWVRPGKKEVVAKKKYGPEGTVRKKLGKKDISELRSMYIKEAKLSKEEIASVKGWSKEDFVNAIIGRESITEKKKGDIMESNNKAYGFFGTAKALAGSEEKAKKLWNKAFKFVQKITGADSIDVRNYLDSVSGRHFADDFVDGLDPADNWEMWMKKDMRKIKKDRAQFERG